LAAVEFVRPTSEDLRVIADNMREADRVEIWASHRSKPLAAITRGSNNSELCAVARIDGIPCAIIGMVESDILTGAGVPWMLGTDYLMKHQSALLRESPAIINEMLSFCQRLYNYVHIDNKASIRWLKWLGFEMKSAEPYGVSGELFYKFEMRCSDV
jgi:ribosomal protein S18 acetylase RimI-like enzyme